MPRYTTDVTLTYASQTTICDFPSPGCCLWTVPTGVCQLTFEIWGAGGGGGAHCCCDCYHGGPGGSAGAYSIKTVTTLPGCQYTVCVGYGGMVPTVGSCTTHWCCYGQQGSTTYVNGQGLSNFCAVGGCGGENTCYFFCGCTNYCMAPAFGGDYNACGPVGWIGHTTNMCSNVFSIGASAPFGGGSNWVTADHCCPGFTCGCAGGFPGGGGANALPHYCCCCAMGGVGGNGLVRIHF